MTPDELDREEARQLTDMSAACREHENPPYLRLMARETLRGRDTAGRTRGGDPDLGGPPFDDERIRCAADRPGPAVKPMNAALRRR